MLTIVVRLFTFLWLASVVAGARPSLPRQTEGRDQPCSTTSAVAG